MSPVRPLLDGLDLPIRPGGGGVGVGRPMTLPPTGQTEKIQLVSSALGSPWALAYGRHIVGGNVIFQQEQANKSLRIAYALGRGEWDSPEVIWVNGTAIALPPTSTCHFHPGLDGELGVESVPGTRNQKICSFYPSAWTPQLTFSRISYLMFDLAPDPKAPGPNPDVRGIWKCRRLRKFDNTGTQTAYEYGNNPADVLVDSWIEFVVKPHAKVNTALTSGEQSRFDWVAYDESRDFCDADPGDGKARFEANIVLAEFSDLQRWIELVNQSGRLFCYERAGKLVIRPDQPRASVMTIGRDLLAGPVELRPKELADAPSRFYLRGRLLDSGGGTASKDFQKVRRVFSKEDDFDQSGALAGDVQGEPLSIDLQNTTLGRIQRTGEYLRGRLLDAPQQYGYRLLAENPVSAENPLELEPGDRIAGPTEVEAFATGDHEVLEITTEPDFSRRVFAGKYDESIFSDALGPEQTVGAPDPGTGLVPIEGVDASGAQYVRPNTYHDSAGRKKTANTLTGTTGNAAFTKVAEILNYEMPKLATKFKAPVRVKREAVTQNGSNGPNSASGGSGWTTSSNITASDDAYATDTIGAGSTGNTLVATFPTPSLPATALLVGVDVAVERSRSAGAQRAIEDHSVKLRKSGSPVGPEKANVGVQWPTTDGTFTYAWTLADLVSAGIALADANAGTVSFELTAKEVVGTNDTDARADHVTISWYYATYTMEGKLVIGALSSPVVQLTNPTEETADTDVEVTGVTPGATVNIEVHARVAAGTGTVRATMTQDDYLDTHRRHFSE